MSPHPGQVVAVPEARDLAKYSFHHALMQKKEGKINADDASRINGANPRD